MTTNKISGGSGHHPESPAEKIAAAAKLQDQGQGSAPDDLIVAVATAVPPLGRRTLWLHWVPSCPFCGYGHAHRAGGLTGGIRQAGCGRGSYYVRVRRTQGRAVAA